jgi:glycosyltransferase involved in cell wall biosynthesis/tetratricopeptide (TPR) repeat protein
MLDDSYILTGNVRNFLQLVRDDESADSYNVFVDGENTIYGSNRIIKTDRKLRYIYKIHEIIQPYNNITIQIPIKEILIKDIPSNYMIQRTCTRKPLDLKLLLEMLDENSENPRTLYYIASTYTELENWEKALEFFHKRIYAQPEGYNEEITDSYLWKAILSQKLNYHWSICEQLYLDAYKHDPSRSDALYSIGYYYIKNNDVARAYEYFVRGFNLGVPVAATSNLRFEIYNQKLPYYVATLAYGFRDYKLGSSACKKYLEYDPTNETIISFNNIYNLLIAAEEDISIDKNSINIEKTEERNIVCFLADGGWTNWSGNSLRTEGIGGSETYIIELAKGIKQMSNFEVYVFCNTNVDNTIDGVHYRNITNYFKFLKSSKIHTAIVSRYSEFIPVTMNNAVENIYLVLHDLRPSGNVIPISNQIRGILCMSDWHKAYFLTLFPTFSNCAYVFPNGINTSKFNLSTGKIKNSFIYSSFPNRGLVHLLRMFPKIRTILPGATLTIFCDLNNNWCNTIAKDEMTEIKELITQQSDYVTNQGWVNKEILYSFMLKAEYWLYPCTFQETFCVTALEIACSRVLAITNDMGALTNTVGSRGIIVPGDVSKSEWWESVLYNLKNLENKDHLLEKNWQWAQEYDWKILTKQFIERYLTVPI